MPSSSDKTNSTKPYNTRSRANDKVSTTKTTARDKASAQENKTNAAAAATASKKNTQHKKEKYKSHVSSSDEDDDDDEEDLDDDDDDYEDVDDDEDYEEEEEEEKDEEKLAMKEYRRFLSDLFPSKYMKEKTDSTPKDMLVGGGLNTTTKHTTSTTPIPTNKKKKHIVPLSSSSSSSSCENSAEEEEEEEEEVTTTTKKDASLKKKSSKINISFIIDGKSIAGYGGCGGGGIDGEDEYEDDEISYKELLYDEDYDDDDEDYDEDDDEDTSSSEEEEITTSQPLRRSKGRTHNLVAAPAAAAPPSIKSTGKVAVAAAPAAAAAAAAAGTSANQVVEDVATCNKLKELFSNLSPFEKTHPIMKDVLDTIERSEKKYTKQKEKETKREKMKNTKKFKTLLREKDVMNDLKYFHEVMTVEEQKHALEQIDLIKKHSDITKPYRLALLDATIPPQYKACAYRKMSTLRFMEPGGSEYYKMKNWVDAFMRIPFGKYKNLPISMADGVDKCHDFITNAKKILDDAVYGLNDAKLQIMQMLGQWIVNPAAIGTSIAIKGPMGTGKTTLVKEGISKILGRDFAFIALGGATDSSFLEGHSYTYEGSVWGKIVDLLIKCDSMNPVIYFDELDKISDTPKGEEIAGILTHLTDTSQNSQFHDRYFSEIDFDLSRCLFIFSYNDESKVNRILLDRMYRIQTKGYDIAQKTIISTNYLLPKIREQVMFKDGDITIPEETLHHIINNHTDKEDGVRTLKRCLEIVHTKLNLYRLMKSNTDIFETDMGIKLVEFPFQLTPSLVDKLIKKDGENGSGWRTMYS